MPRVRAAVLRSNVDLAIGADTVPWAAALLYIAIVSARAVPFSTATFLYADAPGNAYLGAGIVAGHQVTLIPLHSEVIPNVLAGLLLHLAGGHTLVQLLGPLLALALAGVVGATVRALGRPPLLALVATIAAGPIALFTYMFPTAHVLALLGAALLAWASVRAAAQRLTPLSTALIVLASGLVLLGDGGFAVYGLLPLVAAGLVLWAVCGDRRALVRCLTIAISAVVVAVVARALAPAVASGIVFSADAVQMGFDLGRLPVAVPLAAHSFAWLITGGWYGRLLPVPWEALSLVAGCVVPLIAPGVLALQLRRHRRPHADDTGVVAYCVFWAAADVLTLSAYLTLGLSESPQSAYYLIPCLLSASATLPLGVTGRRSAWLARGWASAAALVAAVGLAVLPAATFSGAQAPIDGQGIVDVLRANHLDRGYADYWMSHPLTWISDERVHVFPVEEHCAAGPAAVCRFLFSDASWYRRGSGPTFLITRRPPGCVDTEPRALLGRPQRVISAGAGTVVLVYGYDIAGRFSPATERGCFP